MKVGDICNRKVMVIDREDSALNAARMMRETHVGDLIIVTFDGDRRFPVGIVTDRDIALEIVAQEVDPDSVSVGDLFTASVLLTATEDEDLDVVLDSMRSHGVRRLPVVNQDGSLIGIVTVDDILDRMTDQLTDIVRLTVIQRQREARLR